VAVSDGKARPRGVARARGCFVLLGFGLDFGAWRLVSVGLRALPSWRFIGRYAFVFDFRYVVKYVLPIEFAGFDLSA